MFSLGASDKLVCEFRVGVFRVIVLVVLGEFLSLRPDRHSRMGVVSGQ